MHAEPAFAAIRATLNVLDAELYDDSVPFEATHRRMLTMTDAAAEAVVARLGRFPEPLALQLVKAVRAANRHDLLAARDFILEALTDAAAR